jgi:deferrochelatase/peroxidase EfeB
MSVVDGAKDGTKGRAAGATRRGLLAATAGLLVSACARGPGAAADAPPAAGEQARSRSEPFFGEHQGGILTPAQVHTYFAAFDLVAEKREEVIALLRRWTDAAARMCAGQPSGTLVAEAQESGAYGASVADSGDALGLPPSRLTITFGFGAGLFSKDGKDRYGLAGQRPAALVDMPAFPGDQLVEARSGGDLSVQACADDPQVAFHAVRQLARLAEGVAALRWVQAGFVADFGAGATPRNLMGFKDGTGNPATDDQEMMARVVWVGQEGPAWMRGGSYVVARRSRIALEHWDRMPTAFQEQTFGRRKESGAPLGKQRESDPVELELNDQDGNPVIPENSHVRLAHHASNDGARILRRSYSYNDGVNIVAERWPPWHQGLEYDAGLLFIGYQRDPRTGFIQIFDRMSRFDMMNQFVTNTGSGLFACPPGIASGEYLGQRLFQGA